MKPDSYRVQDGCWNCAHVVVEIHWEGVPSLNCNADKSKVPLDTGSRKFFRLSLAQQDTAIKKRIAWEKNREVESAGKCSVWKKK